MKMTTIRIVAVLLWGSSVLVEGCAIDVDPITEQTGALVAPPASACLSQSLVCPAGGCVAGTSLPPRPPGAGFGDLFHYDNDNGYGSSVCPGYYVIEHQNPSVLTQSNYATMTMVPAPYPPVTLADCATASASMTIYRHTSAGWDSLPWAKQQAPGTWNGTICTFGANGGGFTQAFGGMPSQIDTLRIEMGIPTASSTVIPMTLNINECNPKTCSMAGAVCGQIADGCGGTLTCGTCGAGTFCSSNKCVCSKINCPAGTVWDASACACERVRCSGRTCS